MKQYGLKNSEVIASKKLYGSNILPQPVRQSFAHKLWENMQDPMIKILLVALGINMLFVYMGQADLVEALGITEDTLFETYFDGSSIRVRTLDEEEVRSAMIAGLEGAFDD